MRKIKLKNKNYKIGLGTANFGLKYGIKSNKKISFLKIKELILFAKKNRIKYIDTSQAYNNAEKIIGSFDLNKFKIIDKFKFYEKKIINPENKILDKLKNSFDNLNKKRIDSILFHNYKDCLRPESDEIFDYLVKLKNEKKISKIGVSINSPTEFFKIEKKFDFDIIQAPLNVFDRRLVTSGLKKKLDKKKIPVIIRSIYLQGLLLLNRNQRPNFFSDKKLWQKWHNWTEKKQISKLEASLNFILRYMKNSDIEISVNVGSGRKNFIAYTMDLTKKYIEINADYRS